MGECRHYTSYGRTIVSDHEIDLPLAAPGAPAPMFRLSTDTTTPAGVITGYELPDLVELTLHDDRRVHLRQLGPLSPAILQHLLTDVAVPTALTTWDQPVLHASAVDWGDGAVLFTGPSGSGKSTLAIAAATRGACLVADDGVLVDLESHAGIGSITTLRLYGDHASELLPSVQAGEIVTPTGKQRIDPDAGGIERTSGPRPVLALFAIDQIDDGRETQVLRLGPAEAADVIVRSFFSPPGPPASALPYLDRAASIGSWLPVFRLIYPRDQTLLDDVLDAVRSAVGRAANAASA